MKVRRGLAVAGGLAILTALASAGGPAAAGTATAAAGATPATADPATACGSKWVTIASPNGKGSSSELRAVAGTSTKDIWAVGDTGTGSTQPKPLIEHYDGKKWKVAAIPGTGTQLNAVAAISPKNAWAVGYIVSTSSDLNSGKGLIEHWDGHSWKVVALPSALGGLSSSTALDGIAALSANDIWVVGGHAFAPVALHYDGTHWKLVSVDTSTILGTGRFTSVNAVASNDVWAVGDIFHGDTSRLIEHWDGHAWARVDAAQPTAEGSLLAVDSASSNDVYAVGQSITEFLPTMEVQRYDGHTWKSVAATSVPAIGSLAAVVVKSASSIWAAGWYAKSNGKDAALVMQSTGHGFARAAAPTPGTAEGLALVGGKQLWLVGSSVTGTPPHEGSKTFVARRCV